MLMSIKLLYSIVVIGCLASTAYAKRCKVCNSASKSDCDDPYRAGERYDTECEDFQGVFKLFSSFIPNAKIEKPTATGCLKIKFESKDNGLIFTNRMCYWGDVANVTKHCDESLNILQSTVTQLSCDFCAGDLCNSSTVTGIYTVTVMLLGLLVRMIS